MPWINPTSLRGTFQKDFHHAVMGKLTDALMFWEKIPDNPEARKKMMGWVYEVAEDSGYSGGSPHHKDPFYCIEVRVLAGRFDRLTKQHLMLGFHKDHNARRRQGPLLGRCHQSMGDHRRTPNLGLQNRRTHELSPR